MTTLTHPQTSWTSTHRALTAALALALALAVAVLVAVAAVVLQTGAGTPTPGADTRDSGTSTEERCAGSFCAR